jgi:hypothetical protein
MIEQKHKIHTIIDEYLIYDYNDYENQIIYFEYILSEMDDKQLEILYNSFRMINEERINSLKIINEQKKEIDNLRNYKLYYNIKHTCNKIINSNKNFLSKIKTNFKKVIQTIKLKSENFFYGHEKYLVTFSKECDNKVVITKCLYLNRNLKSVLEAIEIDSKRRNQRVINIKDYGYKKFLSNEKIKIKEIKNEAIKRY